MLPWVRFPGSGEDVTEPGAVAERAELRAEG
jgi:hypothetical protein